MRAASRLLAAALAATTAGCQYPYGSSRYDYEPSFQRVPGYQPGYASTNPASTSSKWDYYRNYQGSFRSGPEKYP